MSDLADKLKVDLDPPAYVGRACGTCRHFGSSGYLSRCEFYSLAAADSRVSRGLCGPEGKNWEPHPPAIGLFGHIRRIFFGGKS